MCSVVVQDDVDVKVGKHGRIDLVEEPAEFHRAVALVTRGEHLPGGDLKSSKE